jgi:transcriptional regulator with XRE-family HTH domain
MDFQERLKQLRKQKGLSQKEISDLSRINQASYSNIESGATKMDTIKLGVAKDIAKALEVSFNDLFEIGLPVNTDENGLKNEIMRLKEVASKQEKMIKLQGEYLELLEKSNNEYKQTYTIAQKMMVIAMEEFAKAPLGGNFEETLESIRSKALSKLKKEFPDLVNLPPFMLPEKK